MSGSETGQGVLLLLVLVTLALYFVVGVALSTRAAFIVVLMSFGSTALLWGSPIQGAWDARPIALVCLLPQALRLMHMRFQVHPLSRDRKMLAWVMVVFVLYCTLSVLWSSNPEKSLESVGAWWLVIGVLVVFFRLLPDSYVFRALLFILTGLVVASSLAVLTDFPDSWFGGRARGLLNNPNGLGIVCMFTALFYLVSRNRIVKMAAVLPVALCVATGSRAAVAGLLIGVVFILLKSAHSYIRLIVVPLIVVAAYEFYSLISGVIESGGWSASLLRDNNSRADVWQLAIASHEKNPWFGVGMGALPTEAGSSYLKALSEIGYLGAGLAICVLVAAFRAARFSLLASGVLVSGVVNALFEGWLFTAGSFYAVILFAVVFYGASGVTATKINSDYLDKRVAEPSS